MISELLTGTFAALTVTYLWARSRHQKKGEEGVSTLERWRRNGVDRVTISREARDKNREHLKREYFTDLPEIYTGDKSTSMYTDTSLYPQPLDAQKQVREYNEARKKENNKVLEELKSGKKNHYE